MPWPIAQEQACTGVVEGVGALPDCSHSVYDHQ
jgi:hypothetical protein